MAITLVANTSAAGASGATTSSIDTTGATLLIVHVGGILSGNPSDNKSNSWTALTAQTTSGVSSRLWYSFTGNVGSGHTFTYGGTVTSFEVAAFGSSDAYDGTESGSHGSGTSATGAITPSQDNCLVIAGLEHEGSSVSVNAGLTISNQVALVGGTNYGSALAYLVQTTAGLVSLTWTISGASATFNNTQAVFRQAAATGRIYKLAGDGGGLAGEPRGLAG